MTINLRKLSTKELAALCQRTMTVSDETAFAVVTDHPLLNAVKTIYNEYDAVYVKKTYSGKGELLFEADKKRDTYFIGIKNIIIGHAKMPTSPYYKQAITLLAIFKKYGLALDNYKYAEETAQMKKLLDELALPENMVLIEEMQLTAMIAQLKMAQDEFEQIFNSIAGENSELRMQESASSMRNRLEEAFRNYINVIKAMKGLPVWKELYAKLDEVVKSVNSRTTAPKTEAKEVK